MNKIITVKIHIDKTESSRVKMNRSARFSGAIETLSSLAFVQWCHGVKYLVFHSVFVSLRSHVQTLATESNLTHY